MHRCWLTPKYGVWSCTTTERKNCRVQKYQAKNTIVNAKINNVDVFTILSDESYGYINFTDLHGAIIRSHTLEIKKKLEETDATLGP